MKTLSPRLQKLLEDKVLETLERAQRAFNITLDIPKIEYRDMSGTAGMAYPTLWKVVYAITLFEQNEERFLNRTVPHEIAHLVTHKIYPKAKQAHGPEWRYVMHVLGVTDNSRCHSYDTSSVKKRRSPRAKPNRVYCGCGSKFVTDTIYRRMIEGRGYRCTTCDKRLAI